MVNAHFPKFQINSFGTTFCSNFAMEMSAKTGKRSDLMANLSILT